MNSSGDVIWESNTVEHGNGLYLHEKYTGSVLSTLVSVLTGSEIL